mmetsp:Transcript_17428/g.31453  ORF Transcript_17428/g.31453 Transcript_17428/m.31453 type:complete len:334 (+) Transcript_17428:6052-7053(+)
MEASQVDKLRFSLPLTVESASQATEEFSRAFHKPKFLLVELPDIKSAAKEASILSRNYSSLRGKHMKWALNSESTSSTLNIEIEESGDASIIKVSRDKSTEYYSTKAIAARFKIKRSPHFKAAVADLWKILNPFHLKALSQKIWLSFNAFLYTQFLKNVPTDSALAWAKQDTDIDFLHKLGMDFADFSNSLFEFIDSSTKSKLANEYTRLARMIIEMISDQQWFKKAELHSRLHLSTNCSPKNKLLLPTLNTPKAPLDYFLTEEPTPRKSSRLSISDANSKSPREPVRYQSQTPRLVDLISERLEAAMPLKKRRLAPSVIPFNPMNNRRRREK